MATEFRFYREWQRTSSVPGVDAAVDIATPRIFYDVGAAKEAHFEDCKGKWTTLSMLRPAVSALHVWKDGRILPTELRPKKDLPEYADTSAGGAAA